MFHLAPKSLQLWIITRDTGRILSGTSHLTPQLASKIKRDTGMDITIKDIINFPRVLAKIPSYPGMLYRGVFDDNSLLHDLLDNGTVNVKRYYSFTQKLFIAKHYGNKKVFILQPNTLNFDISVYSKESEVILDKNIILKLINIQTDNEYTYYNLQVMN